MKHPITKSHVEENVLNILNNLNYKPQLQKQK